MVSAMYAEQGPRDECVSGMVGHIVQCISLYQLQLLYLELKPLGKSD